MDKERQRTTINNIAREAGVSRATVSFVLTKNPHQTISLATREKVQQAARRLGYQSFAPARLLRTGHSSTVLLVMRTIHIAPISAYLVELLAKALNAHGFNLLWQIGISSDPEQPHPASDLVPAVVVSLIEESDGASEAFLHRFGVPVVLAISSAPRQRQVGSRLQATYLFDKGYRHLVVAASRQSTLREVHLEAIRQMCSAYGVEAPVVVMVPENRSALRSALTTLLSENPSPMGVCAVDDETAFAILAALADLNVPVPERVAVIGSGDISLTPLSFPALTTIGIDDPDSYIERLVANILAASRGEPLCDLELLPCRVVVRESA